MSILPIIVVGGAIAILSRKKKSTRRSHKTSDTPALDAGRGTVFEIGYERPDIITAKAGERFSVSLPFNPSVPYEWSLAASPPDNSVSQVKVETDETHQPDDAVGGHTYQRVYIFEAKKAGEGSLVFHLQAPWLEGKEPPSEIVEILVRIS